MNYWITYFYETEDEKIDAGLSIQKVRLHSKLLRSIIIDYQFEFTVLKKKEFK